MMDADKPEPALSPDEWATRTHHRTEGQPITIRASGGANVEWLELGDQAHVWGRDRHAVAALALYHQPYGFTWEDVDLLRSAADDAEWEARPYPDGCADARADLDDLADRIEALLPPRPPSS